MATLVSLRLLGAALMKKSPAQLWSDTSWWTALGLATAVFSGLMLFSINPDVYYLNRTFLGKMLFLAAAILVHYTLVRRAARSGAGRRTIAGLSLALWMGVVFGGVFIGLSSSRPPASGAPPSSVDFNSFLKQSQ